MGCQMPIDSQHFFSYNDPMKKRYYTHTIDLLMTLVLILLMTYSLIGEAWHEILGILMFLLFLCHHVLTYQTYGSMLKRHKTLFQKLNLTLNVLLLVIMIMQPISGILMSRHILTSIQLASGTTILRKIHMALAYWGFVLMSVHIGFHAAYLPFTRQTYTRMLFGLLSVYGFYALIKRKIIAYLLMRVMFAYIDFSEPVWLACLDYLAIMIGIASLTALLCHFLKKGTKK